MPSDQEKLAIAEQITRDCLARSGTLHTDGFDVTHFYDSKGAMFIAWVGHDKKAESRSAIECIYAARQKLAAEKSSTPPSVLAQRVVALECAAKKFLDAFKVGTQIEIAWNAVDELKATLEQGAR